MKAPLARVTGLALRGFFGAALRLRRPRPIHARGRVLSGVVEWMPGASPSGVGWVDEAPLAPVRVVARLSRSLGLPPLLPDVIGLALRIEGEHGPADIELATTGVGFPSRFMLVPHRSASSGTFGTLFPYRGARGPVLLCARTVPPRTLPVGGPELDDALLRAPWRLRLYHATPAGKWQPFATLTLRLDGDQNDTELRFDAVHRPIPGAETYPWVRAVRQPTYSRVQREAG